MIEIKEMNAYIVKVKVPENATAGINLKFETNDFRHYYAIVPENAYPGDILNVTIPSKVVDIKKEQREIKSKDKDINEVNITIPINLNPGDDLRFHDDLDTMFTIKIKQHYKLGNIFKCTIPKESNVIKITPKILESLKERERQFNSLFEDSNCRKQ
tara:strand:+ start:4632 stop:5102 length:471 start_codon:yes stop_codon:yes gene_type:complete